MTREDRCVLQAFRALTYVNLKGIKSCVCVATLTVRLVLPESTMGEGRGNEVEIDKGAVTGTEAERDTEKKAMGTGGLKGGVSGAGKVRQKRILTEDIVPDPGPGTAHLIDITGSLLPHFFIFCWEKVVLAEQLKQISIPPQGP